jgi:two-component system OmpR family sensor kinase
MGSIANLVHSVRFRLTAWYGFLMIVFMLLAGFGAYSLMSGWLRGDLDDQLKTSVSRYVNSEDWNKEQPTSRGGDESADGQKFRSLVVQVSDGTGYGAVTPFDCQIPFTMPTNSPVGTQRLSTQTVCGDSFRVLATALPYLNRANGQQLYLVLAQSITPINDTLSTLRDLLLAIGTLGVLLALQGGWLIAGRALRPISSVTATASTIAESSQTDRSLAGRLPTPRGNDEVAQLTMTFNRMLDRIETEFARRQRFVADASHELRTPLAAIRGNLDVLSMQLRRDRPFATDPTATLRREAIDEGFDDLNREASRMARLLDELLFLARADDLQGSTESVREDVRLDELVTDTVRAASGLAKGQRLEVEVSPVVVSGDRDRLAQVLLILLDNALRYTGPGQRIVVSAGESDGRAKLSVRDEGTGIGVDDLPHVFDRFFRADEARSRTSGGSGLGLAIARTIVEQHGGEITAASAVGAGSTFTVRLPLASRTASGADIVSSVTGGRAAD